MKREDCPGDVLYNCKEIPDGYGGVIKTPKIFRSPNKKDIDFKKIGGLIKFSGKEDLIYIEHACPNCSQALWQSLYEEWGINFISE